MSSREDELRCRCAYNTSLNTRPEATTTDDRKPACVPPPPPSPTTTVTCCTTTAARQVVDPPPPPPRPSTGCGQNRTDATAAGCADGPKSRCRDGAAGGVMNACDAPPGSRCADARPCGDDVYARRGPWTCNPNVCVRLDDGCGGCGGFDQTPYGQQFALCTDRMIKKCACVKFNGLQDSCKHPDCCIRRGCLDKPFPTCLPARKWRFEHVCCRDKMKKKCKPECD